MREVEFRALELDSPSGINWVYGYYVKENGFYKVNGVNDENSPVVRYYIIDEYGQRFDVVPDTVGQYIGMKDRNDVKIYEKDILDSITGRKLEIVFNNHTASFCLKYSKHCLVSFHKNYANRSLILGNSFLNPELLKH